VNQQLAAVSFDDVVGNGQPKSDTLGFSIRKERFVNAL
jgi:hypothetical protein